MFKPDHNADDGVHDFHIITASSIFLAKSLIVNAIKTSPFDPVIAFGLLQEVDGMAKALMILWL